MDGENLEGERNTEKERARETLGEGEREGEERKILLIEPGPLLLTQGSPLCSWALSTPLESFPEILIPGKIFSFQSSAVFLTKAQHRLGLRPSTAKE